MDRFEKLTALAEDMALETDDTLPKAPASAPTALTLAGTPGCPVSVPVSSRPAQPEGLPIYQAAMPNGKGMPLLKSLITTACERNCYYCPFRAGRDTRRVTFKPDEMARLVMDLTQARTIEGAFISSGIAGGGLRTQDRLLDTAEILRNKYGYRGYLHLKLMPGAEFAQIERAMQLANRVSVNLEAPNARRLMLLAPQKDMLEELLQPLRHVETIRQTQPAWKGWNGHWPSSTTQFVVGAVGESDLELLHSVEYLYRKLHLARSYFSGFSPKQGTPFEEKDPVNAWRTHRLYQASFLLRDYGFGVEDLPFQPSGDLPLEIDPKQAWAKQYLSQAPVEVNRASRAELIRVPGIGPHGAQAILNARVRGERLHSIDDLRALGIRAGRAVPFILLDGRRPAVQLSLFE